MRSVQVQAFGDPPVASLEDVPRRTVQAGEVVVRVEAAPVNYVDLVTIKGGYQFKPDLPYTPGKGPAGRVIEVAPGVDLAVGTRVLAMAEYGGYAEELCVDHHQCYPLPAAMSYETAASMSLAFDTAWMALRERARMKAGESILVLGASGAVGQATVQLAKALGASQIIGASRKPDKLEGVDDRIDLRAEGLRDHLPSLVRRMTAHDGVDVVVDPLGGDAFDGAVRCLAWRGRLVIVGFASGRIPTLRMNYPLLKNIEISGLQISDYRRRTPELVAQCYTEIFELFENGRLRPPTYVTFPLSEWRGAMEAVEERRFTARVLLVPNPE